MRNSSQSDRDKTHTRATQSDEALEVPSWALKQLKNVGKLLSDLPKECTGRDRADNRQLSYANYAGLILLGMFSPAIKSLRDIQRASELKKVRKRLTPPRGKLARRTSLGSLSESVAVFDPELLQGVMNNLAARLPKTYRVKQAHEVPDEVLRKLAAVDGSCLQALSQIMAARFSGGPKPKKGQEGWRLHLQYHISNGLPKALELTGENTGIDADERTVLARHLEPDHIYVADRGYEKYTLFNAIVEAGSDYVIRVQRRDVEVVEERTIAEVALAAGVVSDEMITAGGSRKECSTVTHPLRRIVIKGGVPQGRPRSGQRPQNDEVILLTNLLEIPAEVVAAIYRLRWLIEIFFRFLKHVLGLNHLFSTKDNGVLIQVYVGIIAALLMTLATGLKPSRATTQILELYMAGWADEEEVQAALTKEAQRQTKKKK
jgi:hypothetical protein